MPTALHQQKRARTPPAPRAAAHELRRPETAAQIMRKLARSLGAIALARRLHRNCRMAELPRPKALVVYFSRSGTTRLLAEGIARALRADVEELKERRSRRGLLGWLRSGYEGTYALSSETLPIEHDLSAYDLVFVGSPTWNKGLSSPVRGFLNQHHSDLPRVALFATCQGNGAANVIEQMSHLLPAPPLATLAMLERHVKRHYAVQVGELVEAALCSLERVRAAG